MEHKRHRERRESGYACDTPCHTPAGGKASGACGGVYPSSGSPCGTGGTGGTSGSGGTSGTKRTSGTGKTDGISGHGGTGKTDGTSGHGGTGKTDGTSGHGGTGKTDGTSGHGGTGGTHGTGEPSALGEHLQTAQAVIRRGIYITLVKYERVIIVLRNCLLVFFFGWCAQKYYRTTKVIADTSITDDLIRRGYNPCCAYPCLHTGICEMKGRGYICDCTRTGFWGENCHRPILIKWVELNFFPSRDAIAEVMWKKPWLWFLFNLFPFLHSMGMKMAYMSRNTMIQQPKAYNSLDDYTSFDTYYNQSLYARHLEPVPRNCPTQMGIHGPAKLPPVEEVFHRVFRRRHFLPCPKGTNVYFISYAQFFNHQYFKTDLYSGVGHTYGHNIGLDSSNVYGQTQARQKSLRTFKDGKLKTTLVDGEDVVPLLTAETDVLMAYPKGKSLDEVVKGGSIYREDSEVTPKWAMGHGLFSMTPMLFTMATLWVREHNRICDMLRKDHPHWDDERLYQTTRMVITGLMVRITIMGYVQQLSQYHLILTYEPNLTHNTLVQYDNRIIQEFAHLYHWHMMVPEIVRIEDDTYTYEELLFSNNSVVFRHGFNRFLSSLFLNIAGKLSVRNHSPLVSQVGHAVLRHERTLRVQSFNNYRRSFFLRPYKSFMDLTGDPVQSKHLEDLYGHIDAVEFSVGLFSEKHTYATTPVSMVVMGGAWSIKGLTANPIGAPAWFKPYTFGGLKTFDVIRKTSLRDFICRNLRGKGCSKMHVSYSVPKSIYDAAHKMERELRKQNKD